MSSWGRCQDALFNLYEMQFQDHEEPGPVQKVGISWDQWNQLIEPIIEAVYPVAFQQGQRLAEGKPQS